MSGDPDYRCPVCNTESTMILSPDQAFCQNDDCRALNFNPTLPDGGLSGAAVVDLLSPPSDPR